MRSNSIPHPALGFIRPIVRDIRHVVSLCVRAIRRGMQYSVFDSDQKRTYTIEGTRVSDQSLQIILGIRVCRGAEHECCHAIDNFVGLMLG